MLELFGHAFVSVGGRMDSVGQYTQQGMQIACHFLFGRTGDRRGGREHCQSFRGAGMGMAKQITGHVTT
jgi:hypothetical protein